MARSRLRILRRAKTFTVPGVGKIRVPAGQSVAGAVREQIRRRKKAIILRALKRGGMKFEAAEAAGVNRSTINEWMMRDPDFAAAVVQAEARAIGDVLKVNYEQAKNPDGVADRIFFLKTRAGLREKDPAEEVHVAGPIEVSLVDGDGNAIKLAK